MTLVELEQHIDSKVDPRWQEAIALSDIAQYLNLKNRRLQRTHSEERLNYLQDLCNIHELITNNLPAALISPSAYVREWAKFINNNKAIL